MGGEERRRGQGSPERGDGLSSQAEKDIRGRITTKNQLVWGSVSESLGRRRKSV